ncbi:GNAT family N-acetyltransferase [Curvivirga aplysinae]|uniref:GNAT family N-acetyltransferase n=1 Tax=Curvivirga aplysinae TaxID=2529852 RepID=UPI0012BC7A83|nr:N-acetyltransferase [Curvivirga aplysinae]MTI11171.1 N-acetyltransferase [Curvivirga aplysinae]
MKHTNEDIQMLQNLHLLAFGEEEGPIISDLVKEFLLLPETISISIERDNKVAGNIIFTPFQIKGHPNKKCYLLAPVGVLPEFQGQKIGKDLIEKGAAHLRSIGADAIFVLGYPKYYAANGFVPTYILPPYPELTTYLEAWKIRELKKGAMNGINGKTIAVDPIMKPEFWDTSNRPE